MTLNSRSLTRNSTQIPKKWQVPDPPQSQDKLKRLGLSFFGILSGTDSDELLFSPKISALSGYSLLWALPTAVTLKGFINREVGRFTVCTGVSYLASFILGFSLRLAV